MKDINIALPEELTDTRVNCCLNTKCKFHNHNKTKCRFITIVLGTDGKCIYHEDYDGKFKDKISSELSKIN